MSSQGLFIPPENKLIFQGRAITNEQEFQSVNENDHVLFIYSVSTRRLKLHRIQLRISSVVSQAESRSTATDGKNPNVRVVCLYYLDYGTTAYNSADPEHGAGHSFVLHASSTITHTRTAHAARDQACIPACRTGPQHDD